MRQHEHCNKCGKIMKVLIRKHWGEAPELSQCDTCWFVRVRKYPLTQPETYTDIKI